jgi:hypothetical protein
LILQCADRYCKWQYAPSNYPISWYRRPCSPQRRAPPATRRGRATPKKHRQLFSGVARFASYGFREAINRLTQHLRSFYLVCRTIAGRLFGFPITAGRRRLHKMPDSPVSAFSFRRSVIVCNSLCSSRLSSGLCSVSLTNRRLWLNTYSLPGLLAGLAHCGTEQKRSSPFDATRA